MINIYFQLTFRDLKKYSSNQLNRVFSWWKTFLWLSLINYTRISIITLRAWISSQIEFIPNKLSWLSYVLTVRWNLADLQKDQSRWKKKALRMPTELYRAGNHPIRWSVFPPFIFGWSIPSLIVVFLVCVLFLLFLFLFIFCLFLRPVRTTPEKLKTQQSPITLLDLRLWKT